MPKPKVAMYGLTTEGYRLASQLVDRTDVTVVDETLQMAIDLNGAFLKSNPNLGEMMSGEPLLSFRPLERVLGEARVIFFTPKLRRPSDEALIEASSKLRELSKYVGKGAVLVNCLPTGPGGNSENVMIIEKQSGLRVGESVSYAYMPLMPSSAMTTVIASVGADGSGTLEALGFRQNTQNMISAELEYASTILGEVIKTVTEIELAKRAREAKVVLRTGGDETFVDEFSRYVYDLKAIQASEDSGESISYLAGAALKSLENFVRYVVDETREVLKEKELKASRTRVVLLWGLDRYEMRADRIQMAEGAQQRLRDYVTDVEVVGGMKSSSGSEVLDPLKHNLVVVCSKQDNEALRQLRKERKNVETTVLRACPSLRRD